MFVLQSMFAFSLKITLSCNVDKLHLARCYYILSVIFLAILSLA